MFVNKVSEITFVQYFAEKQHHTFYFNSYNYWMQCALIWRYRYVEFGLYI